MKCADCGENLRARPELPEGSVVVCVEDFTKRHAAFPPPRPSLDSMLSDDSAFFADDGARIFWGTP
jgi:hypothetical protein